MNQGKKYDVIIIGAGPAGMSAALYLKRAKIDTLVIDSNAPGGTLNKMTVIENYPGYTDKEGTLLAFRMYSQLEELEVKFKTEKVINIKKEEDYYNVITNDNVYESKYIIIATGKIPKKLDVQNSEKFVGKGISYCAICDGILYKNKDVAIVGGGNSAMEAASYLKDIASNIYIINRSSSLRADKYLQDGVIESKNVKVLYDSKIKSIIEEDGKISGIKLNDDSTINVSGIFVCIGQESNIAYYQNLDIKTDNLGILVDQDMKTNLCNVYACGDAISKKLYQVVTAASEGAIAATNIIKDIKK